MLHRGWLGGKNARAAPLRAKLHATKSHDYPRRTGSSDSVRGLIERWATSVHAQDIDGVLADHAEDMVM